MPKLGVLTRTVRAAITELFGVIVIFIMVMMAFTITCCILYGHAMEEFSTFGRSMCSLVQIALDFGNLEHLRMYYLHPDVTNFMMLFLFTAIVWVLILNMLLGIITESFIRTATERRDGDQLTLQLIVQGAIAFAKKKARKAVSLCRRRHRGAGAAGGRHPPADDAGDDDDEPCSTSCSATWSRRRRSS